MTLDKHACWRTHRKTMSWAEWFFPRCSLCLTLRVLLGIGALACLALLGLPWPLAVVAAIASFMAIGSAANYLPPPC